MNKNQTTSFISITQKCKPQQKVACILTANLRLSHYRRKSSGLTATNEQWWANRNTVRTGSVGSQTTKAQELSSRHSEPSPRSINVINLLHGNSVRIGKVQSNLKKKITMSNLDKYYEYCLKKVESKDIHPCSKQLQHLQKKEKAPEPIPPQPIQMVQEKTPKKLRSSWCLSQEEKKQNKSAPKQNLTFFCKRAKSFNISQRKKPSPHQQIPQYQSSQWNKDNLSGWVDQQEQFLEELMI